MDDASTHVLDDRHNLGPLLTWEADVTQLLDTQWLDYIYIIT